MYIMTKLKYKPNIFKSSKTTISLKKIYLFIFCKFCFIYIKMSKNLSDKYYHESKERLLKKLMKDIKIFLKKKNKKKQKHDSEHHKNLSEDEKNTLV